MQHAYPTHAHYDDSLYPLPLSKWVKATLATGIGFGVMLIGSVYGDELQRLVFYGIPLPLIFVAAAAPLTLLARPKALEKTLLVCLFLCMAIPSLFYSPYLDYGLGKILNLLVSFFIASAILSNVLLDIGPNRLGRILLGILVFMLVMAVGWKLAFGFFNRQVLFFMNGPIVFARIMGIGAILSFFCLKSKLRFLVTGVFLAAMFWTESKGPVFAVILTYFIFLSIPLNPKRLAVLIMAGIALVTLTLVAFAYEDVLSDLPVFGRYFQTLDFSQTSTSNSNGLRMFYMRGSMALLAANPILGVGLGGWGAAMYLPSATYPHNLLLEVLTEMGLIMGPLFLIPYVMFLRTRNRVSPYYYVGIFFWLASLVSGDILDSRYILVFGTLAALDWYRRTHPEVAT